MLSRQKAERIRVRHLILFPVSFLFVAEMHYKDVKRDEIQIKQFIVLTKKEDPSLSKVPADDTENETSEETILSYKIHFRSKKPRGLFNRRRDIYGQNKKIPILPKTKVGQQTEGREREKTNLKVLMQFECDFRPSV